MTVRLRGLARRFTLSLTAALAFLAAPAAYADGFDRVPVIEENVRFWRKVYAVWGVNDIALHDRDDLSVVYRVARVPGRGQKKNGLTRSAAISKARDEVVAALASLDKKRPNSAEGLSGVEKEVYENLKHITRADKYKRPADIRAQNGLRERAREGWIALGRYEAGVRAEIRKAGMPQDIIALAFVESLFNIKAVSHAGAAGMWQFMPYTGREYMQVNEVVDERIDPILATEAAMKYLRSARKLLGAWPLAITSYNYGRSGMKRASKAVGSTDFGVIYEKYKSNKRFGFAAKNYYASFLALLDVVKAPETYFKGVKQKSSWRFDVVRLPFPVLAPQLEKIGALSTGELASYNPALTRRARSGDVALPRGLSLRVPYGEGDAFLSKVVSMSFDERKKALHHIREWHRANGRQTLASIAKRYGVHEVDVAALAGLPLGVTPGKGVRVPIPSREARYTLIPEARSLKIPHAPALPEAVAVLTPVEPPPEPARKQKTFVARVDDRPKVRLRSLQVSDIEPPLPAVDLIAGADAPPLGDVDVIAGDPGLNAPWRLPASAPNEVSEAHEGTASDVTAPPTS